MTTLQSRRLFAGCIFGLLGFLPRPGHADVPTPPGDAVIATSRNSDFAFVPVTSWRSAFTCDGATLDVDIGERRNLQLVVRDPSAIAHFDAKLPKNLYRSVADGQSFAKGLVNAKGELILRGGQAQGFGGVFEPHQFVSLDETFTTTPNESESFSFVVRPKDHDDLEVVLARAADLRYHCSEFGPESICVGTITVEVVRAEATWRFACSAASAR